MNWKRLLALVVSWSLIDILLRYIGVPFAARIILAFAYGFCFQGLLDLLGISL